LEKQNLDHSFVKVLIDYSVISC